MKIIILIAAIAHIGYQEKTSKITNTYTELSKTVSTILESTRNSKTITTDHMEIVKDI